MLGGGYANKQAATCFSERGELRFWSWANLQGAGRLCARHPRRLLNCTLCCRDEVISVEVKAQDRSRISDSAPPRIPAGCLTVLRGNAEIGLELPLHASSTHHNCQSSLRTETHYTRQLRMGNVTSSSKKTCSRGSALTPFLFPSTETKATRCRAGGTGLHVQE